MQQTPSDSAGLRFQISSATGLAWDSLRAHKLRTFLTLLGVMIGVASVILVGSAIDGLGLYAEQSTAKTFGSESFVLQQVTNARSRKEFFDKIRYNRELKLADEHYLELINGEHAIYSAYRNSVTDAKRDNLTSENTIIIGAESDLPDIRDLVIVDGRFYSKTEEQNAAFVAVIGDDLKNNLFPAGASPVGKIFKIQGLEFTVVGVQERLGSSFGRSQDNAAMIPITTYSRLFGPGRSLAIFGRPRPSTGESMQQALDSTRVTLRSRFHQKPGEADRFDFITRVALRARFHQKPGEADRFDFITPDAIRAFIDS